MAEQAGSEDHDLGCWWRVAVSAQRGPGRTRVTSQDSEVAALVAGSRRPIGICQPALLAVADDQARMPVVIAAQRPTSGSDHGIGASSPGWPV